MMRAVAFALALCAPLPALALSCVAPSVERSYQQLHAAKETYVIVHGRLTFDESQLPKGISQDRQPAKMTQIKGTLLGKSLGKTGFKTPFDQLVTLEVACFGPWCGAAKNGQDVLAFVRRDAGTYAIGVNPCGGFVFSAPKRKMLKAVQKCMRGGSCKAR